MRKMLKMDGHKKKAINSLSEYNTDLYLWVMPFEIPEQS